MKRMSGMRLGALLAGSVLALAACSGPASGFTFAHETPDLFSTDLPPAEEGVGTITVASLSIPHNAPFIALPAFAEKYGLDVEWQSFQRYSDTQIAVSRGDVNVAAAGYHTVALDTAPTNVTAIAGGNSGAQALVLRPDLTVDEWTDLEGLRIGVAPNSGPDVQFQLAAAEAGIDPGIVERINFTTLGPPTLTSLENRQIDGILCWEVVCAQAVESGRAIYSSLDIGENPTGNANTLALANSDWLEQHPNAATRLVRAYVDAIEYFNKYPDELSAFMENETGSTAAVTEQALTSTTLEWELHRDKALATARAYSDLGISGRDMTSAVEELLEYSYLEDATGMTTTEVGG